MPLIIGEKAPDFTLQTDDGTPITLSQLRPSKVVLYFYPKDNTPGCTKEACDFRESFDAFKATGALVLGISKDSMQSHVRFRAKYHLPFPLLVDINGEVCKLYGVLNEKSLWGRIGLGIERATFLIDETGLIAAIWRKVTVKDHVKQVYDALI
ncbi:MAG: hypothetical protein A3F43_00880 [Gammaproteobacteria bacterium RIFCSPHIGHO2_12_FULL_42_10]|nr:MAG: hypothetical protein A3F43_00880 [Gammaproteobacteria bacterium RIFCSPHIGHO2_12_FULL_42_10]